MESSPELKTGNIGITPQSAFDCYIVGFPSADGKIKPTIEVAEKNTCVDIRSVKYSSHLKADKKAEKKPDDETRITILLNGGPWRQTMWLNGKDPLVYSLVNPGDYISWEPGYFHSWEAEGDATLLTVSMQKKPTR